MFASLFLLMWLGGARQLASRAARVRARAGDVDPLRAAHRGAEADAGRRVRVPDAVLLPEGRHEHLRVGALGKPRCARPALRREDGAQARGRLSARAPLLLAARDVHDSADEHGSDVRDDQRAVRAERAHHRPHAVLAARRRRRAVGDRADGDRAALLPTRRGGAARPHRTRPAGAARLKSRRGTSCEPARSSSAPPRCRRARSCRSPSRSRGSRGRAPSTRSARRAGSRCLAR